MQARRRQNYVWFLLLTFPWWACTVAGGGPGPEGSDTDSTGGTDSGGPGGVDSANEGDGDELGDSDTTGDSDQTGDGDSGSGGAPSGSGGLDASGGVHDDGSGGDIGSGGVAEAGGSGGQAPTCVKGTTEGREVLFIGESFVSTSSVPVETTKLARAAGSLGAADSYVSAAIAGAWLGNGANDSIPAQYNNNSSGVRFVLMTGGAGDCWQGGQTSDRDAALSAAQALFEDMDANGVEKVVYFFYPDPSGTSFASVKTCFDLLRPEMKELCDGLSSPECHWVDLRATWDGHPEYTNDGLHIASAGNVPTATAIFDTMQEHCVAP